MSDLDIRDMRPDERPEDFAGIRRSTWDAWVGRHAPKRRQFDGPTRRMLSRDFNIAAILAWSDTLAAWAQGRIGSGEMNAANGRIDLALDVAKNGSRPALSQAIRIVRAVSADPGGPAMWSSEGADMRRALGLEGTGG